MKTNATRLLAVLMLCGSFGTAALPATAAAKSHKHCVAFKTYKSHGHHYKRCAKYSH